MSKDERKGSLGFRPASDTNPAVQSQKMATSLKFLILEDGELYYLCSENKGADQVTAQLICAFIFA